MDTQPILDKIHEDALSACEATLSKAKERGKAIEEESIRRSAEMHLQAQADAALEAEQAQDRARRLRELEDRKYGLTARRDLIGRAFEDALNKLHALPDEDMAELMLALLVQNAKGNEALQAGGINDGFYTSAFIENANQSLLKTGKPGQLKDAGSRIPGCSGLVLSNGISLSYLTLEALIELGREGMEQQVADLLFKEKES